MTVADSAKVEARRLLSLPAVQARAQFGDRIARAFLADGPEQTAAFTFDARLATEIREQAAEAHRANIWGAGT